MFKRIKLITMFMIVCLVAASAGVSASTVTSGYSGETNNVLVKGTVPAGMFNIVSTVTILLADSNYAGSETMPGDSIGYFGMVDIDPTGSYSTKFKFTKDISNYKLIVKAGDCDVTSGVTVATIQKSSFQSVDVIVNAGDGNHSLTGNHTIKGTVTLANDYGDEGEAVILASEYDAAGCLIDVNNAANVNIPYVIQGTGRITENSIEYVASENAAKVKFYAWKSISSLIPLGGASEIASLTYGVDKLGNSDGELKVAFLGGSITEGTAATDYNTTSYAALVRDYFIQTYPNKTIKYYNAGIGGTNSTLGSVRNYRDLIPYEPDVVFIEYAVNDSSQPQEVITKSMETIVRSFLRMKNRPTIIFLYSYSQSNDNSISYQQQVADYYGIGSINFKQYVCSLYSSHDEIKAALLNDNVHPTDTGHRMYADFIINALQTNPDNYFKKLDYPASNFGANDTEYKFIPWNDESAEYSSGWYETTTNKVKYMSFPRFTDGLMKADGAGNTIVVTFEGDSFGTYCHGISNGNTLRYNVDNGKKTGSFDSFNLYDNYQTVMSMVTGLGEGAHTIVLTTSAPAEKIVSDTTYTLNTVELAGFFVEK